MIAYEEILMEIKIYDDAYIDDNNEFFEGGEGKLISYKDFCQQFNYTEEGDRERIGPTDPVDIGPKVSSWFNKTDQILVFHNPKAS